MNWELCKAGSEDIWVAQLENGETIEWKGFGVGPLALSSEGRATLCRKLLMTDIDDLKEVATQALNPFRGPIDRSLIMHCTTSDLGSLKGDISELRAGIRPKNHAGYTETRSPFLGKAGDLALGRMESWKISAQKAGVNQLIIPNLRYYYLSDALLLLAEQHQETPQPCLEYLINYLKRNPKVVARIYVLDISFQIFLTWLQRKAGLKQINFDANSPEVAKNWNNKNILYPTVMKAKKIRLSNKNNPYKILAEERQNTPLFSKLGLNLPGLPGYVIKRKSVTLSNFCQQTWEAAQLLKDRYGLEKGCLKACEAGDGARITPNIYLSDRQQLEDLATEAYTYGDDYVLESHFYYETVQAGRQTLRLTPSAHIRSGMAADGITLQLTKGTTWIGNLYINEKLSPHLNISEAHFKSIQQVMVDFLTACQKQRQGLAIGGIDFAIGRIGGKFGEDVILGIQDPNISFNGAEFLREFMNRTCLEKGWKSNSFHAVTYVFVPINGCVHDSLEQLLERETMADTYSKVVAVVPNSWAMIGIAAREYPFLIYYLEYIQKKIAEQFNHQEKADTLINPFIKPSSQKDSLFFNGHEIEISLLK